ncbi:hypothetical protein AB6A40_011391 [Gnathostoma spinigerum]|uniref:Tuberin N-terminal domain-containing protein n=1 Tax=Gnathostoma spinigerum TaxID=75299 RepID=A0ABD6F495_9BILA
MSAWNLMRDLLRSHCGHTVLSYLLGILDKAKEYRNQKVVVGAIDIIAMSLWGTQRVESLRCHPSAVLPVLAASMDAGPVVIREVFISIKRLIRKYGKDLQQLSWHCLLQLLSRAVVLCKKLPPEERRAELTQQLHLLIDMIEQLYRDGEYAGSPETMFSLIESCSSDRPPSSLIALLDHRAAVSSI